MKSLTKTHVLHQALCGILSTTLTCCTLPVEPDPDALKPSADWTGLSCDDNQQIDLLNNLNPTQAVDGMLLYSVGGREVLISKMQVENLVQAPWILQGATKHWIHFHFPLIRMLL